MPKKKTIPYGFLSDLLSFFDIFYSTIGSVIVEHDCAVWRWNTRYIALLHPAGLNEGPMEPWSIAELAAYINIIININYN